jgi:response regulator RpfG family c-di-GMP phosphodiesterase
MLLAKIVNWLRDLWCRFFWPREAISNIQLDVVTILAETRMQHEMTMTKLIRLGAQMSEVTDALADLNDATNEVAGELDAAAAKIQELTDVIAGNDPESAAKVAEALAGIGAAATRLRGLAEDPENPVPPVEEPPVDDGGDNVPPLDA